MSQQQQQQLDDYPIEPPLLQDSNGNPITTKEGWEERRLELVELFRSQVYGRMPPESSYKVSYRESTPEEITLAGSVQAILQYVTICVETPHNGRTLSWKSPLLLPVSCAAAADGSTTTKAPIFLLVCNSVRPNRVDDDLEHPIPFWPTHEIIKAGFATLAFYNGDIAPDDKRDDFPEGLCALFHDRSGDDAGGAISAWAWGFSRMIDYLHAKQSDRINLQHIAVIGHSRGGKTALWAAAQDERIAMACSNDSGNTGASLSRHKAQGGETVERINTRFPHWFCRNYRQYNDREDHLPIDQHQLLALIAPRTLYVASATEDVWADPVGEYLATCEASKVWSEIYQMSPANHHPPGVSAFVLFDPSVSPKPDQPITSMSNNNVSYHIRSGKHDLTLFDWQQYLSRAKQVFHMTN